MGWHRRFIGVRSAKLGIAAGYRDGSSAWDISPLCELELWPRGHDGDSHDTDQLLGDQERFFKELRGWKWPRSWDHCMLWVWELCGGGGGSRTALVLTWTFRLPPVLRPRLGHWLRIRSSGEPAGAVRGGGWVGRSGGPCGSGETDPMGHSGFCRFETRGERPQRHHLLGCSFSRPRLPHCWGWADKYCAR